MKERVVRASVALSPSLRDDDSDYTRVIYLSDLLQKSTTGWALMKFALSVTMSKQQSSWNHRGKKLRPGHCLQVFLLVAVGIWLMYQLGHCYKRRAVAVKISGSGGVDGELIRRRWLDRKSLIKLAGVVSREVEDASGISGGGIIAKNDYAVERKPGTNKGTEDEGDEYDDGLFGYDDGDDRDFHPENGESEEINELDRSAVRRVNTTGEARDDVADQLVNAAAHGIDMGRQSNNSFNTSILKH